MDDQRCEKCELEGKESVPSETLMSECDQCGYTLCAAHSEDYDWTWERDNHGDPIEELCVTCYQAAEAERDREDKASAKMWAEEEEDDDDDDSQKEEDD
jgi:hypothetical protein